MVSGRMSAPLAFAALFFAGESHPLPPSLSQRSSTPGLQVAEGKLAHLTVPLDHFAEGGPTWQLRYYYNDTFFRPGGVLLLNMPNEGPATGCAASPLVMELRAIAVCAEHRFFGESVPGNSSTVGALAHLSVEQNLADQVALVRHLRASYSSISSVVAHGGSYAGASSAWIRHLYPEVVDAAIALSPPVAVRVAFPEYDTSNLVALASPDYRCAQTMARVTEALERQLVANRSALMRLFSAEYHITSDMGDVDFMYGLGDAIYGNVQYGRKAVLCEALRPLFGSHHSDAEYVEVYANYTLTANGEGYFSGCWYNSTCMRESFASVPAESARSWYWLKCTELGYFQVSPREGLRARPRGFDVDAALAQCAYIFPGARLVSDASTEAFNAKFGGGALGGTARIFELDFSDDPWKMSTSVPLVQREEWPLGPEQPFLYLTCDGCGHCAAGLSSEQARAVDAQIISALREWGIAAGGAHVMV